MALEVPPINPVTILHLPARNLTLNTRSVSCHDKRCEFLAAVS